MVVEGTSRSMPRGRPGLTGSLCDWVHRYNAVGIDASIYARR
jgi:hypothetical protein